MPTGTGVDRQVGYAVESSYGAGVVVTRFLPAISATITKDIQVSESNAQIAGAKVLRSTQWMQAKAMVGGDVQHELHTQSMGLLLRAAFGTVTTTGAGPSYTHVFSPADKTVSFTTQVGVPATFGSVLPQTSTGCKVQSWEIAVSAGEIVTWGMTVVAQEQTYGTAIATPSYAANLTSWHARSLSVQIDGTLVPTRSFSVKGETNLTTDDRLFAGSTVIAEPLSKGMDSYTGQIDAEWGNPSALGTLLYQRFLTGTEGTLVAILAAGTLAGTITANIRFDGTTPTATDSGITPLSLPFTCVASGTLDSSAISVRMVNNDAAA